MVEHMFIELILCVRHEFRHWGHNSNADINPCPWSLLSSAGRHVIRKIAQLSYIFELENQIAMQSGAHGKVRAEKIILGASAYKKWL